MYQAMLDALGPPYCPREEAFNKEEGALQEEDLEDEAQHVKVLQEEADPTKNSRSEPLIRTTEPPMPPETTSSWPSPPGDWLSLGTWQT